MSNRLIHELSPYLLQHADNPVDWYPWGDEAHTRAREADKPIFLSIGYASCHWCHVMEQECFMDQEVADLLNQYFIPIKVDREERPDIDRIYMTACQMMTGSGGWPLSLFLTTDLQPFYAATFIPRHSGRGMPGMLDIIPYIADLWKYHRSEVNKAGEKVIDAFSGNLPAAGVNPDKAGVIPDQIIHDAYRLLSTMYDPVHGGFGKAPRFPSITYLTFLLQYGYSFDAEKAFGMVMKTLSAMADGGIRDQIGYGFHRYATDSAWKIPHFEKMLYDQAMNAMAFTRGWQITGDRIMQEAAIDCLRYMRDTLQKPEGGFASAEDADSPGGEGVFYLWQADELRRVLSPDEFQIAEQSWGIREGGNIPSETGFPAGSNILAGSLSRTRGKNSSGDPVEGSAREIREKLYQVREKRPRPLMDDKILTDWNGLAIEALATAAMTFDDEWLIPCAEKAAGFLQSELIRSDGTLFHRWRNGKAGIEGTAQDYIFAASGLVSLFQATGKIPCLRQAIQITDRAISLFGDEDRGGFFATRRDDPSVPVRMRDEYDGPVPSVNGHAYRLLQRLTVITGNKEYQEQADRLTEGMVATCRQNPLGALSLIGEIAGRRMEIRAVITGNPRDQKRQELWRILTRTYIPGLVIIPICRDSRYESVDIIPDAESVLRNPEPEVWICAGNTCRPPITDPGELQRTLLKITHF